MMVSNEEDDDGSLAGETQTSKEMTPSEDKPDNIQQPYRDMIKTPPPTSAGKSKRNAKRGKIGKKPADMPRRPLSGYNYFFSDQRSQILEEQTKVKDEKKDIFTTLGRIVADRWKKLGDEEKEKYNDLASKDLIRYRKEMEKYNEKIAMRNRKEAEKDSTNGSASKSDQVASTGERRLDPLLQGIPQGTATTGSMGNAMASFGRYPNAMSAQGYPNFVGSGLAYHGGLARPPRAAQSMDLGSLTLTQHQNLAARKDPMLGRVDLHALLGQLPPPPDHGGPRVHVLYPQGGMTNLGYSAQPSVRMPYQPSLSTGGFLTSQEADALLLQNLGSGGTGLASTPQPGSVTAGASGDALMGRIRQQYEDDSIRQAYAHMLQRRQAEEEEAIRQLRQRHWPSG